MLKREEIICKTCEISCDSIIYCLGSMPVKLEGFVECRVQSDSKTREETYWCAEGQWHHPEHGLLGYVEYLALILKEKGDSNE